VGREKGGCIAKEKDEKMMTKNTGFHTDETEGKDQGSGERR
jgi:hypothetical protein